MPRHSAPSPRLRAEWTGVVAKRACAWALALAALVLCGSHAPSAALSLSHAPTAARVSREPAFHALARRAEAITERGQPRAPTPTPVFLRDPSIIGRRGCDFGSCRSELSAGFSEPRDQRVWRYRKRIPRMNADDPPCA